MDIAFLFPPGGQRPEFQVHLGVSYIQANLKRHQLQSTQVVPSAGSTLEECVDAVLATGAPVVGLTCFDNSYYLVHALARRLKRRAPALWVLVGGPSATFSDRLILEHSPEIDICVRYEAEQTLAVLLPLLLDKVHPDALKAVPGISFRDGEGIHRTEDAPQIGGVGECGLDSLPSPFLSGILDGTEGTGLLTSRGCNHRCTYCNFSALGRHRVRYHSVERVIAELKHIEAGLKAAGDELPPERHLLAIHDDAFTLNAPRAKDICRRIIDEGIDLQLSCLVRADNLDEELIILLKKAGFYDISFGLESAVPRILRNIKKVTSVPPKATGETYEPEKRYLRQVEQGVALAKKHELPVAFSIILGLPGETKEDGLATMAFVDKLGGQAVMQNFLMAFPGTEVFREADKWGLQVQPSEYMLPYRTRHAYPVADIPLHPKSSLQRLSRSLAREVVRMFTNRAPATTGTGGGIHSALILAEEGKDLSPVLEWLADHMAICSTLIVLGEAGSDISSFRRMVASSAIAGIPTRESFFFQEKRLDSGAKVYTPVAEHATWWPFRFPLVPLTKRRAYLADSGEQPAHTWMVYQAESSEDRGLLKALAELPEGLLMDGAISDGCRWSHAPCPAANLKRVVLTAAGEIRACLSGPALGTIQDSLSTLRFKATQRFATKNTHRMCTDCTQKDQCSKCLAVAPTTDSADCALYQESRIGQLVGTTNLTHAYHPAEA